MNEFKTRYQELEAEVQTELGKKILKSDFISKHTGEKAIQVNLFDYTELAIINERLTFLNSNGYHFSLYSDCSLEDLIDLL